GLGRDVPAGVAASSEDHDACHVQSFPTPGVRRAVPRPTDDQKFYHPSRLDSPCPEASPALPVILPPRGTDDEYPDHMSSSYPPPQSSGNTRASGGSRRWWLAGGACACILALLFV